MFRLVLALATALAAQPALAQGWPDLDRIIRSQLTDRAPLQSSYFMPDGATPATATRALAVAYTIIPGAAGNVSIHAGLFRKTGGRWAVYRRVEGLFGQGPRDPAFAPNHVDVTTTVLGPGEPRCCPTQKARWRINLTNANVTRLE